MKPTPRCLVNHLVTAISYPHGNRTISQGKLTHAYWSDATTASIVLFGSDLLTSHGGSGGPVLDSQGQLVGMLEAILAIVGLGGGAMSFRPGTAEGCVAWGCSVTAPYGGTRLDLMEVIALAEAGMIEAQKTYFPLEDAVSVYSRLEKGEIQGRAVFVPAS